jgi:hypothetical protein
VTNFTFVGYLVQGPFLRNWPKRKGYKVATIERHIHPSYDKFQWNVVEGMANPTKFLSAVPHEPIETGWVLSGYALPREIVEGRVMTSNDGQVTLQEFGYALKLQRKDDNLKLLGYEVVDEKILFLSILNNCGYTVEEVRQMAGPLNEYSLFSSLADAGRFKEAIKIDPRNPKIIPDHSRGIIVEVWGQATG